jgi:hypothetical protein
MLAASMERDNHPVRPDGHVEPEWQGPDACRAFVRKQAAMGFDSVKFLLSNDDVFIPGGSQITQYTQEEASAGCAARRTGPSRPDRCPRVAAARGRRRRSAPRATAS